MTPSISAIVPGLQCAATLERSLEALRAQAGPAGRHEVVYADCGSTDAGDRRATGGPRRPRPRAAERGRGAQCGRRRIYRRTGSRNEGSHTAWKASAENLDSVDSVDSV